MCWRLKDDLSYCIADDALIFMDVQKDRYFRLPPAIESAFITCIEGDRITESDLHILINHGIVTNAPANTGHGPSPSIAEPLLSVYEHSYSDDTLRTKLLPEVLATVFLVRLELKARSLKEVLERTANYRKHKTRNFISDGRVAISERLLQAAMEFRTARLFVPFNTSCLLDSLSLVRFLSRRRLYANIVFGVVSDPFSAHCWVQTGDTVLNDSVGNVSTHTSIRVV